MKKENRYAKKHRGKIDIHTYKDYLRFAKLMGLNLKNKKYLFPDNLQERHDELEECFKINNREILNTSIAKRYDNLKENIYQDEKFIIIPAKSVESLEQESKEQSNCVRTYSEKYATGNCDIYFIRSNFRFNNWSLPKFIQNKFNFRNNSKSIIFSFYMYYYVIYI